MELVALITTRRTGPGRHRGSPYLPSTAEGARPFSVRADVTGARTTIVVCGALELASRDQVLGTGYAALGLSAVRRSVLDLGPVNFLDAAGLGAMVAIRNAAYARDVPMSLAVTPERVRRLLAITALDQVFVIADTDDGVGGHGPTPAAPIDPTTVGEDQMSRSTEPRSDERAESTPASNESRHDTSTSDEPTETEHPTGEAQAAENAENEPAG